LVDINKKNILPNVIDSHFKTDVSSFALRMLLVTGILAAERIRITFLFHGFKCGCRAVCN